MNKILKLTGVSMLAIMSATNANAAGYTCEELVDYTSCSPGYYMTEVDSRCPEDYHYATGICYDDDMGEYYTGYEPEDCVGEYYTFYQDGCLDDDEYNYEPVTDGGTVTSTCLECPAGSYCVGGDKDTAVKMACADGTYQPETGKASCETCPTPTMYPEYLASVYSGSTILIAPEIALYATPKGTYCVARYDNLPIENGTLSGIYCSNWGDTDVDDYSQCIYPNYQIGKRTISGTFPNLIRCDAGHWFAEGSDAATALGLTAPTLYISGFNKCKISNQNVPVCQSIDFFLDVIPSCVEVGQGYFSTGGSPRRSQCPVMTDDSGNTHTATTVTTTSTSVTDCIVDLSSGLTDDKGTYNRILNCAYDDPAYYPADDYPICDFGYTAVYSSTDNALTCMRLTESECNAIANAQWYEIAGHCGPRWTTQKIYYDGTNMYIK